MTRVGVVGGGPAGLAAAIHAAVSGASAFLLERNGQCGVKLLATGGGHCNVANLRPIAEWPPLFGRRGRFIAPALAFLDLDGLRGWLEGLGVPLASPDGFHLFPASRSAKAVRDALVAGAIRSGVEIHCGKRIDGMIFDGERLAGVSAGGEVWPCDQAILTTGGRGYPATGSTGDGWALAARAGHSVRPPFPGLVGLRVVNLAPNLAGLVLPDAGVSFKAKGRAERRDRGELLLTHGGVSGPAVLDLSGEANEALTKLREVRGEEQALSLEIRWIADMDRAAWEREFGVWRRERGATPLLKLVRERLPQRLARWLCEAGGVTAEVTAATLGADAAGRLAVLLGAFPTAVVASEGWDRAMITRGGVDLRGVRPETLESAIRPGLFFAGEVLDIDGPCGGYNLHWAFASGALAGTAAAGGA